MRSPTPTTILAWSAFVGIVSLSAAGIWDAITHTAVSDAQFIAATGLLSAIVGGLLGIAQPTRAKPQLQVTEPSPAPVTLPATLTGPSVGVRTDTTQPTTGALPKTDLTAHSTDWLGS